MTLTGKNLIAGAEVHSNAGTFAAGSGARSASTRPRAEHIGAALEAADRAFEQYRTVPADQRAALLEQIAVEIEALGDELLAAAHAETALPVAERLVGERGRTVKQLRLFADLAREGLVGRCAHRPGAIPIGSRPARTSGGCSSRSARSRSSAPATFRWPSRWPAPTRPRRWRRGARSWSKAHPAHPGYVGAHGAGDHPGHREDGDARRASFRCCRARATTSPWRWCGIR